MNLIASVRKNGKSVRDLTNEAANELRSVLPQGVQVRELGSLALLVIECPTAEVVDFVRSRVSSCRRISTVVDDFGMQLPAVHAGDSSSI
jgi:hypothetical protein